MAKGRDRNRDAATPLSGLMANRGGQDASSAVNVRQAFSTAQRHLSTGDLQQAERVLQWILAANSQHVDALNLLGIVALRAGDRATAARILSRALEVDSRHPDTHCNLGIALLGLGRDAEVEAAFAEAVRLKPSHPMANYNLGLIHLRAMRFEAAARHLERALKSDPGNVEFLNACGIAVLKWGKPSRAKQLFRKAHRAAPENLDVAQNLAAALTETGEANSAIDLYESLLRERPDDAELHFHSAIALSRVGRQRDSIAAYGRALEISPEFHDARANLGNLLSKTNQLDEAVAHLEQVARARPDDVYANHNLAEVLRKAGSLESAESVCREILDRDPDFEITIYTLVLLLRNAGRFDEAWSLISDLRSRNPQSVTGMRLLSSQDSRTLDDQEIGAIEPMAVDPDIDSEIRTKLHFELGRIFQKRADHETAFRYFREANRRRDLDYAGNTQNDRALVDAQISAFSAALFDSPGATGSHDERPIFIVGMPRSGTTLVEQIISSHPQAEGAGELGTIGQIAKELSDRLGSALAYPDCVGELKQLALSEAAQFYSDRISRISDSALRISDKMPGNYMDLGLIALMFPHARVIHCGRDARATCMSIYFNDFDAYHPYACDLNRIGLRYHHYRRLMVHWSAVLRLPMLSVDYEAMVGDVEATSRQILEFCDLPWDERVLQFYETKRVVQTTSMWQVRRPIYRDSLDLWRHYERHLEPLEQGLAGERPE